MSYHPFTDLGHTCPGCGVTNICTMEDGQCDSQGKCSDCINEELNAMEDEEREYREMMQSEYDQRWN